jgi:hypothetical protein
VSTQRHLAIWQEYTVRKADKPGALSARNDLP